MSPAELCGECQPHPRGSSESCRKGEGSRHAQAPGDTQSYRPHTCTHVSTGTHRYACVGTQIRTHTCMCSCACVEAHACTRVNMDTCVRVPHGCQHMCVRTHIWTCPHTHTDAQTHVHSSVAHSDLYAHAHRRGIELPFLHTADPKFLGKCNGDGLLGGAWTTPWAPPSLVPRRPRRPVTSVSQAASVRGAGWLGPRGAGGAGHRVAGGGGLRGAGAAPPRRIRVGPSRA